MKTLEQHIQEAQQELVERGKDEFTNYYIIPAPKLDEFIARRLREVAESTVNVIQSNPEGIQQFLNKDNQ